MLKDEKAWQFVFPMEVKSLITRPAPGMPLKGPGFYEISGLAWSGNGSIQAGRRLGRRRQELGAGRSEKPDLAEERRCASERHGSGMAAPRFCKAARPTSTGMVQPTRAEFADERGLRGDYHYNAIASWSIDAKGEAGNVYA